jgi:hypothetical protein
MEGLGIGWLMVVQFRGAAPTQPADKGVCAQHESWASEKRGEVDEYFVLAEGQLTKRPKESYQAEHEADNSGRTVNSEVARLAKGNDAAEEGKRL